VTFNGESEIWGPISDSPLKVTVEKK